MKMKNKVTLYTVLLVAAMAAMLVSVGYYEISHTFYQQILTEQESRMRVAWTVLSQEGSPIEVHKGKLYAGKTLLNGNSKLVDQITSLVGGTATIFQGDTRVATNIRLPDGTRAEGTKIIYKNAKDALNGAQSYRGEALILGEPYVTAYDPIKNGNNEVIGILQVGAPKSAYHSTLTSILRRSLLVTSLALAIIGFIVYVALHNLSHELQAMALERKLLLESTGEGIYGIDLEGRCTFINQIGATMLGYPSDELVGKPVHSTIHHSHEKGDPYLLSECKLCSAYSKEKIGKNDDTFWRKDGTSFQTRYLSAPLIKNGVVQGAAVTFSNVTAHKHAQEEIHEALMRAIHGPIGRIKRT